MIERSTKGNSSFGRIQELRDRANAKWNWFRHCVQNVEQKRNIVLHHFKAAYTRQQELQVWPKTKPTSFALKLLKIGGVVYMKAKLERGNTNEQGGFFFQSESNICNFWSVLIWSVVGCTTYRVWNIIELAQETHRVIFVSAFAAKRLLAENFLHLS